MGRPDPRVNAALANARALYRFRELVLLLVQRDLKVRYKRSVLGMAWTLLNPLLQMAVYSLVFSVIMKIGTPAYPLFLLAGLLPWSLVSVSTTSSALSLIMNQGLIRKVAVPQAVYPLAIVGSKLFDTLMSVLPLALIAALFGRPPGPSWVLLPVAVVLAAAFTAGLSLFFSSVTVFFRDVRHLVDILFQIWFYVTPVLYPASFLDVLPRPWMKSVLLLNPARPIVGLFQKIVYEQSFPTAAEAGVAVAVAAAVFLGGFLTFTAAEDRHIHNF